MELNFEADVFHPDTDCDCEECDVLRTKWAFQITVWNSDHTEKIFGPVVCAQVFDTTEEVRDAIRAATEAIKQDLKQKFALAKKVAEEFFGKYSGTIH